MIRFEEVWYMIYIIIKLATLMTHVLCRWKRKLSLAGIILCMRPANERRRYIVTSSLIGWVRTQIVPRSGGDYECCVSIFEVSEAIWALYISEYIMWDISAPIDS